MQRSTVTVAQMLRQFERWDCADVRDIIDDLGALVAAARALPEESGGRLLAEAMDLLDKACARHWPHTAMDGITYWAADRQGRLIVSSGLFKEPRILGGLSSTELD